MTTLRLRDHRAPPSADEPHAIIAMHPRDFLRLAGDGTMPAVSDALELACIPTWTEWPQLEIDPETRQVLSHEGRHRMARLLAAGYQQVDVIWYFTPDPLRGLSLEAALAWQWRGRVPDLAALRPQAEHLAALQQRQSKVAEAEARAEHRMLHGDDSA